jgi:hypothetical protein
MHQKCYDGIIIWTDERGIMGKNSLPRMLIARMISGGLAVRCAHMLGFAIMCVAAGSSQCMDQSS